MERIVFKELINRLIEPRHFIQVLFGPRQVGKTTITQQVMEQLAYPVHYVTADEPALKNKIWIEQQWQVARLLAQSSDQALLIMDEIQKIQGWSEIVKRLWDEDTRHKINLRVILLGSAPLLVQQGLTESLAGRFELLPVSHWSYSEMHQAFQFTVDEFIYFGGYPGAAHLIKDENRWQHYIKQSLIETTISRDILLMTRVDKPGLLRQLFHLGCEYSGQILAYQKMLGQLHDAGNTTTLAHYLSLLGAAGMITGLNKFSGKQIQQRASSPKLQVLNTALMSAQSGRTFSQAQYDREFWGRLVESAVGAHLINSAIGSDIKILYWRERNKEVDFVLTLHDKIIAIEVKSGGIDKYHAGSAEFMKTYPGTRVLQVGEGGLPLHKFFTLPCLELFNFL